MRVVAVPVKSLGAAKGRLAGVLSPVERAALTLAMLEDVLDACETLAGWHVVVVSPDQSVLEVAARRRARPVREEKPGLVSAIRQVEDEWARAEQFLVVLADLPLVTPDALHRVVRTLGPVVAAPSSGDAGTNVLLRRPPRIIPAMYGTASFERHTEAAELRGIPFATVHSPELAYDLDRPEDLPLLLQSPGRSRTRSACLDMGLAERLSLQAQ